MDQAAAERGGGGGEARERVRTVLGLAWRVLANSRDGSDDDESEEEEDDEDDVDISSSPRFKPQAASSPRRRKRYRPDSDDEDEHSAAISMGPRNALDQNGVGVNGTHPPRIRLRTSLPANAALRHDAADHPVAGPSSRANGHHDPHALDIERLRQTAEYREKCAQVMELEHDVETMRQAAAEKDKRHQAELERVRETHMGLVMRMTNEHAAELERLRTTLPLPHVGQEGMKEGLEVEKRRIRVEMEKEYAAQLEKEKAEMRTSIEREVRRELEADAAPREVQDDHRRLRASLEAERAEKERLKTRIIELQDRVIQMSDEARRGA